MTIQFPTFLVKFQCNFSCVQCLLAKLVIRIALPRIVFEFPILVFGILTDASWLIASTFRAMWIEAKFAVAIDECKKCPDELL